MAHFADVSPKVYDMSQGDARGNGINGKELRLYEEKVAMSPERKYNEKDSASWNITTHNDFIGRVPDMDRIFTWIDARGDEEIDNQDIARRKVTNDIMINIDVVEASRQLWAFLDIHVTVGEAVAVFRNVAKLNGLELGGVSCSRSLPTRPCAAGTSG